jgi:large subunit ribosomal protein L15
MAEKKKPAAKKPAAKKKKAEEAPEEEVQETAAPAKKAKAAKADGPREIPILSRLRPPAGAVRPKRRKGRGVGSGLGKTAGKGMKGQKARHPGGFSKLAFEGGQTPLQRRLPKHGFHNPFSKTVVTVNVADLNGFDDGDTVDVDTLRDAGLVRKRFEGGRGDSERQRAKVKVLGSGDLEKKLTVRVHAFSASAKQKIEKAGGTAEVIETKQQATAEV